MATHPSERLTGRIFLDDGGLCQQGLGRKQVSPDCGLQRQVVRGDAGEDAVVKRLGAERHLNGQDAEDKLRILAWLAFGVEPASLKVIRRGIDAQTAAWAAQVAATLRATTEPVTQAVAAEKNPVSPADREPAAMAP